MTIKEALAAQLKDLEVRTVFVHSDFFQNDVFLHVEVTLTQGGAHHVGEQIEQLGRSLAQHRAVIDGALFIGIGVVVGTKLIKFTVDVLGAAPVRTLKHHVFQKVRHPGDFRRFVSRARIDKVTRRHRLSTGIVFTDNGETVRKRQGVKTQGCFGLSCFGLFCA